ncbi:disaggregatase related repeat protein [bacterium BMS3Abin01]|nr:disaggregatase related repeat protein [bacterium BMS3Abin01]
MADGPETGAQDRRHDYHNQVEPGRAFAGVLLVLAAAAAVFFLTAYRSQAVLGPDAPYTEANGDIIEICADAACMVHTTEFNPGDTVYVRVTTDRVGAVSGKRNRMRLRRYQNTNIRVANWTQVTFTAPYIYTSQVTIPAGQSDYMKIWGRVRNGGSGPRVQFEQQISLYGLNQYARIYSDAARTDESYTFAPGATVYIRAWGTGADYDQILTGSGQQRLRRFTNSSVKSWAAPAVTRNGNWYDFQLTLPAGGLTDGDWYWLRTRLLSATGDDIQRQSRMLQIDASAPTAIISDPSDGDWVSGSLPVRGTVDDAYSFYNYLLEYGAGAAPVSWTQITIGASPVLAGLLGTWDTAAVSDGLYTLRLTATDRAYNTAVSSIQVNVDNTFPVISAVQAGNIASSNVIITWTTDEAADSQVEYGTSSGVYTWSTPLDSTMLTGHSQPISGLQESTTYYYRVRSADRAGNISYSAENSFRTANITVLQPFPAMARDTYIGSSRPAWNRGAETSLQVGDLPGADWGTMRSLLDFDLGFIPAGATINSATMSLYQMGQGDSSTPDLDAHYLTGDWSEGTGSGSVTGDGATWDTYDGSNSWTSPGGDFNATAGASAVAPGVTGVWVDWDLAALTRDWIDGTVDNFGVLIKQDPESPTGSDAKEFYSSEYVVDRTLRPKLTIEWLGDDVTPPNLGEVRAENITTTTADIKWSSCEGGTSQVEYGTTTSYGSTTTLDTAISNQHVVSLSGLTAGTVYHYRVRTIDPSGNETVSGDYVFQAAIQMVIQPGPADGVDDTLQSYRPDLNSGATTWLLAGDYPTSFWGNIRCNLRFDLSAIPTGSTINSATLSLYQAGQGDTSTPTMDVHYLTRDWTEGTGYWTQSGDGATWNTYDGSSSWASPGGDFNATVSASAVAPAATAVWVDWDLAALTQSWVNGTVTNRGMIIKKDVENPAESDVKLFYSSDFSADPSLRPKLVIEYVPAPGSITVTIDDTWNRDGTPGTSSVGFGNVSEGTTYYVGDASSPAYAARLTVKSNVTWGLKVASDGDLLQSNPANFIDIVNLGWKQNAQAPSAYQPFVKTPASTIVADGLPATAGASFLFDYRLVVPAPSVSGSYTANVVYTAYPE